MRLFILCIAALSCMVAKAQNYAFSYVQSTYQELINPTEIPVNEFFGKAAIPFTFKYYGQQVDTVFISLNGALDVDGGWLHGIEGDLESHTSLSTRLSYKVEGTAPYRMLKMEWKNLGTRSDSADFDSVNFQIWFMEHSHAIEMHFGASYLSQSAIHDGVFLGKNGPNVGVFGFFTDHHALQGDAASPEMIRTFNMTNLNDVPQTGLVYRFTPLDQSNPHFVKGFGGTTYAAENEYQITWSSVLNDASIEQSLDGGQNWVSLANNLTDSFYHWTAPKQATTQLLFRLKNELGIVVAQSEYANAITVQANPGTGLSASELIKIDLYPNPTSSILNVRLNGLDETASLVVLDHLGKEVGRFTIDRGELSVPVENFKNGFYQAMILVGEELIRNMVFIKL